MQPRADYKMTVPEIRCVHICRINRSRRKWTQNRHKPSKYNLWGSRVSNCASCRCSAALWVSVLILTLRHCDDLASSLGRLMSQLVLNAGSVPILSFILKVLRECRDNLTSHSAGLWGRSLSLWFFFFLSWKRLRLFMLQWDCSADVC